MVIEEEKTEEEGEWGTTLGFSTTERRATLGFSTTERRATLGFSTTERRATLGFSTTERRFTLGWHRGLFLAAQVAQAQAIAGRLGTSFKL